MCLLDLFRGMEEDWWAVEMTFTCLGGFLFGGSNRKNVKCGEMPLEP